MNHPVDLAVRLFAPQDRDALSTLVIEAFEPITWQKKLDAAFGPLNARDWRQRWRSRLDRIFESQVVLVGEVAGELAGMASASMDQASALAFLDVLAIFRPFQGRGYGREMLRAAMRHYRELGCHYVNLDCLSDNEGGNALYESEGFVEVARHIRWFRQLD